MILPYQAFILGVVEGLTEFLPVSSTGHLILTSAFMGLMDYNPETHAFKENPGLSAYNIVIQSGALLAVIGMYLPSVRSMILGLLGKDPAGLKLFTQLVVAFLPAVVLGVLFDNAIEAHLFKPVPVAIALAVGGVWMIGVERRRARKAGGREAAQEQGMELSSMTLKFALIIGFAQCVAMWPGTSRSMMTIVAALMLGFKPRAAAEFSFLLALPTLGGATVYKLAGSHGDIMESAGMAGLAIGIMTSCVVAWLAVKMFLEYLKKHGMEVFGWYRIALAAAVVVYFYGVKS